MGINLADIIGSVSVPESGTEQIEYIDIDRLKADADNFYQLSDIDELADNISTIGLQQPVRVRETEDGYTIISGHRRTEAMRKLLADGDKRFETVPCIVERGIQSPALLKLKLIYANAATRRMTSAETAEQVKQIEDCLYALKEEGFDFPGRMVNHVADACKISKTRVSNLKLIQTKLQPCWSKSWQEGKIAEETALALARLPQVDQADIWRWQTAESYRRVYSSDPINFGEAFDALRKLTCTDHYGDPCHHRQVKREHMVSGCDGYSVKKCGRCCRLCIDVDTCKDVCPDLKDEIKARRAEKREAKAEEDRKREEQTRPERERIAAFWHRFDVACQAAGEDAATFWDCSMPEKKDRQRKLDGKIKTGDDLPFWRFGCYQSYVDGLIKCADRLSCTTDYLLLRTDEPNPPAASVGTEPHWSSGTPDRAGMYYCQCTFEDGGKPLPMTLSYDGSIWRVGRNTTPVGDSVTVVGWWPLPEVGT